jgi:hypothetical protein
MARRAVAEEADASQRIDERIAELADWRGEKLSRVMYGLGSH